MSSSLSEAKRIMSMWPDDCSAGGAEVKSRLVATEVANGIRDDCFEGTPALKAPRWVVSLAASRGRILAFFDVVAAFVHALIDKLVIQLLPSGLGENPTGVLHKALCGTRVASILLIFARLGDKKCAFGCCGDDLLVEADEEDVDAVEAHLMKPLAVKVLARIGGDSSGEAGFFVTWSFVQCCGKRYVQDAAATLQLTGRSHEYNTADTYGKEGTGATLQDRDQKFNEILYATKTVASFMRRSRRWPSSCERCAWGFPQAEWVHSSDWGRRRGAETLDLWSCMDLRRLSQSTLRRRRNRWSRCLARRRSSTLATAGPHELLTCYFLTEAGNEVIPRVWSDSSACRGIVRRQGAGRLRRLEIQHMWTQSVLHE